MLLWLQLLSCIAAIGYAGFFFPGYGNIIAVKTGAYASWINLRLLLLPILNIRIFFLHG